MHTAGKTFFSYSRDDREVALSLARDLRNRGVDLWVDRLDIAPGAPFREAIDVALDACSAVLVVLTERSAGSHEVETEWNGALAEGKPVIPVVVEACRIPRRLAVLQYTDLSQEDANEFERLVVALGGRPKAGGPELREPPPAEVQRASPERRAGLLIGAAIGLLYGGVAAFAIYLNDSRNVLLQATASYAVVAAVAGAIAGAIAGKDAKALLPIAVTVAVVGVTWVAVWGTYADVVSTGLVLGGGIGAIVASTLWALIVRRGR